MVEIGFFAAFALVAGAGAAAAVAVMDYLGVNDALGFGDLPQWMDDPSVDRLINRTSR